MYTALNFEADLKSANGPKSALNRLKKINKKVKETIEYYGYKAGKPYSQMERGVLIVHYPVIVDDVNSDETWDHIYKDVSFDVGELLDIFKLDDVIGFEGQEVSKKSKNTIDIMFYLK